MAFRCQECGGLYEDDDGCATKFGLMLEREFIDPDYGSVHHLTVAGYMLQHATRLSRRGWIEMRGLLRLNLREGVDPARMRQRIRKAGINSFKGWSLKPDGTRLDAAVGYPWALTVVSIDMSSGERYREDVARWADAVLVDAERLAPAE